MKEGKEEPPIELADLVTQGSHAPHPPPPRNQLTRGLGLVAVVPTAGRTTFPALGLLISDLQRRYHETEPQLAPRPPKTSPPQSQAHPTPRRPPPRAAMKAPAELLSDPAMARLWDLAFHNGRKRKKLKKSEQASLVTRLHDRHIQKLDHRGEPSQSSSRLTHREQSNSVERLYYESMDKAAKLASTLTGKYEPEPRRVRLTKEMQEEFVKRVQQQEADRRQRHAQRLQALTSITPPNGVLKVRNKAWLELHAKELYQGVPAGERTPAPD
eukprot:Sspe_Gene.89926::Locus_61588_Transcript_1_1_Confidence_1.000_Length_942::g.89926::m.89926